MGREQKKQAKQKRRERKNVEKKQFAERAERQRVRRDQYPQIVIDPTNGNPEFVQLVRDALAAIRFDDSKLFSAGERQFYRQIRQHGFGYALRWLREEMRIALAKGDAFGTVGEQVVLLQLGTILLNQIPEVARRQLMPYNDAIVEFVGQKVVVKFSSMLSQWGPNGTIYFSRRKPTVNLDGKEWTVAFSEHAVERICDRLKPNFIEYAAAGDIHAFFSKCIYFEPITLYGNQPAFTLYDWCGTPPYKKYSTYVEDILGETNVDPSKGKCYYRVGYCPVACESGFAKAKTFLYPGFKATPEYRLVLRSGLSRSEKDALFQESTTNDATKVLRNDDLTAIKWFHENGLPQVVHMKQAVFA